MDDRARQFRWEQLLRPGFLGREVRHEVLGGTGIECIALRDVFRAFFV